MTSKYKLSLEGIRDYGIENVKTVEGIVEEAFAVTFPFDARDGTFIKLEDGDDYQFEDKYLRIDKGEKVRIYTSGLKVGQSGNTSVEAVEVLDDSGDVKMTYVENAQYLMRELK